MDGDWSVSDEDLLDAYRNGGQTQHLEALFTRYISTVRTMLYQVVLNDADADDLTQEVFVRVARGIGRFNGNARFSTWLYRITMNQAHSFLASRKRNPVSFRPSPGAWTQFLRVRAGRLENPCPAEIGLRFALLMDRIREHAIVRA